MLSIIINIFEADILLIYLLTYLLIYLFIYLFLFICSFLYLLAFIYLFIHLFKFLSFSICVFMFVYSYVLLCFSIFRHRYWYHLSYYCYQLVLLLSCIKFLFLLFLLPINFYLTSNFYIFFPNCVLFLFFLDYLLSFFIFSKLYLLLFLTLIIFQLLQFSAAAGKDFMSMNLNSKFHFYVSTLIRKSFGIYKLLFYSLFYGVLVSWVFWFELSNVHYSFDTCLLWLYDII